MTFSWWPWVSRRKYSAALTEIDVLTAVIQRQSNEHVEKLKQHAVELARLAETHARELQLAREEERQQARQEFADELAHHQREHRRWLEHAASKGDYNAAAILGGVRI